MTNSDCFNGFTLNDCDFENVKDYPTNAPDVDEGNETNPVA